MNNGSYDAHPFTNDLLRTLEDRDKSGGPLMLTAEVPLELGARTNGMLQRQRNHRLGYMLHPIHQYIQVCFNVCNCFHVIHTVIVCSCIDDKLQSLPIE